MGGLEGWAVRRGLPFPVGRARDDVLPHRTGQALAFLSLLNEPNPNEMGYQPMKTIRAAVHGANCQMFTLRTRSRNQRESGVEDLVDLEDIRTGPYNIWKYIGENHHITTELSSKYNV